MRYGRTLIRIGSALGVTGIAIGSYTKISKVDNSNNLAFQSIPRVTTFLYTVVPMAIHYKYVSWQTDNPSTQDEIKHRENELNRLHDIYSEELYQLVVTLKGTFVKAAQVLSMRADILPSQYITRLKVFQSNLVGEPIDIVRKIITQSFEQPVDTIYEWIDETPIGAASLGQVHIARLSDEALEKVRKYNPQAEKEVAIKIQYPMARYTFRIDLLLFKIVAKCIQPSMLSVVEEISKGIIEELNYEKESQNLKNAYESAKPWKNQVIVPVPYEPYISRDILTMEYLEGEPLEQAIKNAWLEIGIVAKTPQKLDFSKISKTSILTSTKIELTFVQKVLLQLSSTRSLRYLLKCYRKTVYAIRELPILSYQYFVCKPASLFGYKIEVPLSWRLRSHKDAENILRLLMEIHGHQIFNVGEFTTDPHGGLIDYGQVSTISTEHQINLKNVMKGICEKNVELVANSLRAMGVTSESNNSMTLYRTAQFMYCPLGPDMFDGEPVQNVIASFHKDDKILTIPPEVIFSARVAMLLKALGVLLGVKLNPAEIWAFI